MRRTQPGGAGRAAGDGSVDGAERAVGSEIVMAAIRCSRSARSYGVGPADPPPRRARYSTGLASRPTTSDMQLTQCPYDRSALTVEHLSGGAFLLSCEVCEAVWERHGALIERVHGPDLDKVRRGAERDPLDTPI